MARRLRLALAGLAVAALAAMGIRVWLAPHLTDRIADSFGQGDYRLETTAGTPFTAASLKGAPSIVFFGYTHCPDVCPTTLGDIATWQDALGEKAKGLRVFFITVDPERDTGAVLKDYLSWLPGAVGVTGNRAEIDKAIKAFHIYARKIPDEGGGGGYSYDHTASVLLFDARGHMTEPVGYGVPEANALAALHRLLDGG